MLSFRVMLKEFEQLIKNKNESEYKCYGMVVKLKNEYFTQMEDIYDCMLERYRKSIERRSSKGKQDYCAIAFFFKTFMHWGKIRTIGFPIDIFDEKGTRFSEVHNRKVKKESLKITFKTIVFSLLGEFSIEMLNPKAPYKAKIEFIKSLNIINLNESDETIISLFRSL
jgi:hypothetical protein